MTNTISRYQFESALELVPYSEIYEGYSGRGMFLRTCVGIVTGDTMSAGQAKSELLRRAEVIREEVADLADEADDGGWARDQEEVAATLERMAESVSYDNLGRDFIVYFPAVEALTD